MASSKPGGRDDAEGPEFFTASLDSFGGGGGRGGMGGGPLRKVNFDSKQTKEIVLLHLN